MLFQSPTFVAFSILSFSSYISTSVAGHTYAHHHHLQAHRHEARIASRADSGFVQVPLSELHLLQTETSAFQDWMTTWIDMESQTDRESSVALLQQEIQAYQGWMRAWLDAVSTPGGPTTIPLPSSVPVTLPLSSSLELSTSRIDVPATSIKPSSLVTSSSSVSVSASILPTAAGEFFLRHLSASNPTLNASSGIAPSQTSFVTLVSPKPTKASISTVPVLTSRPPAIIPVPVVSAPPPVSSEAVHGSGGPFSGFNPQSSRNLAVYYGQTAATGQTSLGDLCKNENVDIVILAFLTDFFGAGGFPKVNFGPACGGQTAAMQSAGASGLLSCPDMASQISQCQSLGKKVLLSLGGSLATSAFSSDSQASGFATKLWDLFGAGTGIDPGLRPFGDVKVDGFDVDNEDHSTLSYSTFVSSLRTTMNQDTSKVYYISAAPQCPRPDASIPLDAMQNMDFVFVQFYNNAAANCNVGQSGFLDSLKAWSADLAAKGAGPKLYVGAPGCVDCAGAGYLDASTMASAIGDMKIAGISNMGGIMLWDGPEAMANVAEGKDYTAMVKGALK